MGLSVVARQADVYYDIYDLMGVKRDENLVAVGPIPGEPHPDSIQSHSDWSNLQIAGIGAGWLILGGIGVYAYIKHRKNRGR